jgi:hypothetical protein
MVENPVDSSRHVRQNIVQCSIKFLRLRFVGGNASLDLIILCGLEASRRPLPLFAAAFLLNASHLTSCPSPRGESVRAGLGVQGVTQPLHEEWLRSPSQFCAVEMDPADSSPVSFPAAHLYASMANQLIDESCHPLLYASMVNQLTDESCNPPLSSHVESVHTTHLSPPIANQLNDKQISSLTDFILWRLIRRHTFSIYSMESVNLLP